MATKTTTTKAPGLQMPPGYAASSPVAAPAASKPVTNAKTTSKPSGVSFDAVKASQQGTLNADGTQNQDKLATLANQNVKAPTSAGVSNKKPAVYPVLSADLAKKDLVAKNNNFNNIVGGMQQQQLANIQTQATQDVTAQQKATTEAAAKPSKTLDEIKSMVSGDNKSDTTKSLEDINKKADLAYADYKNQVDQIRRGAFPLSPDQQAQVDYTQRQFDRLNAQQKVANQNYESAMAQLGIVSGRNRYAPEIQTGLIKQAVDDGVTKLGDIEAKAANTVATLRQGFMDKNYELINNSYSALTNLLNQKSDTISKIAENVRAETNTALAIHKQEMDDANTEWQKQQAAIKFAVDNNISKPFYLIGSTAVDAMTGEKVDHAEYLRRTGQNPNTPEGQADYSFVQTDIQTPEERQQAIQQQQFQQTFDENVRQFGMSYALQQAKAVSDATTGSIKDNKVTFNGHDYVIDAQGNLTEPEIPGNTPQVKLDQTKELLNLADDLLNDPNMSKAVGPRSAQVPEFLRSGAHNDFLAKYNNFIAKLTIGNLSLLKGPMSDKDILFLKESASSLNPNMTEQAFQTELGKIREKFAAVLNDPKNTASANTATGGVGYINYNGQNYLLDAKGEFDEKSPITGPVPNLTSVGNTTASSNQVKGAAVQAQPLQHISMPTGSLAPIATAPPKTLTSVIASVYPDGSTGGQCGDFVRQVGRKFGFTYPALGDSLASKTNAVQKYGTSPANARPGSVIVTKENPTYGHVAYIVGKNAQGWLVAESNYKQAGKVSYGRVIPFNSDKIVGVINPS